VAQLIPVRTFRRRLKKELKNKEFAKAYAEEREKVKRSINMVDSLGDRMKKYESTFAHSFVHRTPLIIRVDGQHFHSFTRGFQRPFDGVLMASMVEGAMDTAKSMQGFKLGYIQSDEASFMLTDFDAIQTQGWFNYEVNKIVSSAASMMTINFYNRLLQNAAEHNCDLSEDQHYRFGLPTFDARAFNIPLDDAANYFVWRNRDWLRNSLQMYCQSIFSHKELLGKNSSDMHEMLHKLGRNWATDLTPRQKNGTLLVRSPGHLNGIEEQTNITASYDVLFDIINRTLAKE